MTLPITLDEAKAFLRVTVADDDAFITMLIDTSRALIEQYTVAAIGRRTEAFIFAGFADPLIIPRTPVVSVASVAYLDSEGAAQTVDAADYRLTTVGVQGALVRAYDVAWPSAQCAQPDAVTVTALVGWETAADVPQPVRLAALLMVSNAYDDRAAPAVLPDAVKYLLTDYYDMVRP